MGVSQPLLPGSASQRVDRHAHVSLSPWPSEHKHHALARRTRAIPAWNPLGPVIVLVTVLHAVLLPGSPHHPPAHLQLFKQRAPSHPLGMARITSPAGLP